MTVGSKWETVDDQGGSFVQRGAAEGLSVHGGREVTEEGSAGSQGRQRKALTTPLGLLPRSPLGRKEGILGTELGLDRIRRYTRCSGWSRSLVTAGQGYREDCGQLRRKGLGRGIPKHHGGHHGGRGQSRKGQWGFCFRWCRRRVCSSRTQPLKQPPDPRRPLPTSKHRTSACL